MQVINTAIKNLYKAPIFCDYNSGRKLIRRQRTLRKYIEKGLYMKQQHHTLLSHSVGTRRELVSLHFGTRKSERKVYLQASLHADEAPGMLVLHHLRRMLEEAEQQGLISGEVVLVPYANPIGLSQHTMGDHMGRFDAYSGENFNRNYPDFYALVEHSIEPLLCEDENQNKKIIRQEVLRRLEQMPCNTELESMRMALLRLSHDADWVLDIHCDYEALVHVYTDTPYVPQVEGLACYLGAEVVLFSEGSGGSSFDEAQSSVWYRLRDKYSGKHPIPLAGCGVTVELRGEADVSHELASADAVQLFAWLQSIGIVDGDAPPAPSAQYVPTPVAGYDPILAPVSGVLVYKKALGSMLKKGDIVAEIVDPLTNSITTVSTVVDGKFFARENRRFVVAGMPIGKVAGSEPYRTGMLLSS